ncbi:MAG: carbamoyltransferase [Gammaproteobacteria bacterium]
MSYVLGISAYYHDSAAALVKDGHIIASAQEERFTRKKHDPNFPAHAICYCLQSAGIDLTAVDYVTFYDKPLLKFERLLETYLFNAPKGWRSFCQAMPIWLKEKLFLKHTLKEELSKLFGLRIKDLPKLLFTEHHESHAASAFYPSPFKEAAVLCLDGVGEWATTSAWMGQDTLTPIWQLNFPHSLGLLYSAFTYYTGFKVNSGEYKLMGLAPYGQPKYVQTIYDHLIDVKSDGTFRLNMDYFSYPTGLTMTSERFHALFGGPPRKPESEVTQKDMDLARSIQAVTEEILLKLGQTIATETKADYLCLAGGVALNCVANGKLLRSGIFKDIWIQPAAGDAGGALGAALATSHNYLKHPRDIQKQDNMQGAYLGPSYDQKEINEYLNSLQVPYHVLSDTALYEKVSSLLADGNVIGWFQGRMEFGPRALGGRSIIGDPRNPKMQSVMNLKIKYRESFRPFAPAVRAETVSEWFEIENPSPYMLLVADVHGNKQRKLTEDEQKLFGIDKLNTQRSDIPAVTHVDYSARIQTVHERTNPRFYALIKAFEEKTGCSVLINTSFNVRGEPIVCSIGDAYRCFMRTEMDYLIIENALICKAEQPTWQEAHDWRKEFVLD